MNIILKSLLIISLGMLSISCEKEAKEILLFAQLTDSNREAIEKAQAEIEELGKTEPFTVTLTEDANNLTEDYLREYATLIFLYTSGEVTGRCAKS